MSHSSLKSLFACELLTKVSFCSHSLVSYTSSATVETKPGSAGSTWNAEPAFASAVF